MNLTWTEVEILRDIKNEPTRIEHALCFVAARLARLGLCRKHKPSHYVLTAAGRRQLLREGYSA